MVCLDKNKFLWEDVIKTNKINWICVWDQGALQSRAASTWNVKSVPANYIINQKKEIVGKNLYGSRLEDRLNDLLKNNYIGRTYHHAGQEGLFFQTHTWVPNY